MGYNSRPYVLVYILYMKVVGVSQIKGVCYRKWAWPQKFAALSRRQFSFRNPSLQSLATPLQVGSRDSIDKPDTDQKSTVIISCIEPGVTHAGTSHLQEVTAVWIGYSHM